jgi:hypothetical protein
MIFIPTKDFFSEEFGSQYMTGHRYTVRDGNDKLRVAVEGWIADGVVSIAPIVHGLTPARVSGIGKVE